MLYRLYVDEVGNHDMTHADDPNQRFLSLTGVILESEYTTHTLRPELEQIKAEFFQHDPDEPIIFHRKELVNKRPPFHPLLDFEVEQQFNLRLLTALAGWDYRVITIVLDKLAHRERYAVWRFHPYHYCMTALLERFVLFLHYADKRGDVMVEQRGGREDRQLKDSYRRLWERGNENIPVERWQAHPTSGELKVKPKNANVADCKLPI
jgi:hypothetical protein